MGRYQVQSPDGHTFEFEAPDDATPEQLDAMTREAAHYAKNYPVTEREPPAQPPAEEPGLLDQFGGNLKNDVAGIAQGATALPDMAASGVGKILSAVPNLISEGLRAAGHNDAADWIQSNVTHPLANPLQIGEAIESIAPTPETTAGKVNRFAGQMVGGVVGFPAAAAENVVARIVGEVPKRVPVRPALTEEQELLQAAERQGIDVLPADVGGPVTRRASSMASQTIAGGAPIIKQSEAMHGQAQAARDRIASSIGQALEPIAAGQQAISGANATIRTTADDARVFYSAAEKASAGERLSAPKAIAALDKNIAELGETPGGAPGLSTLQSLRDDLAKGKLTVGGIRRMRTVLRDQFMQNGLTGSDLERRVGQVLDAAADDVTDGLTAANNKGAADLFAKGDAAWRQRAKLIDEVIQPIIGKDGTKSGEAVIKTLTADLQGNNARAVKFLKSLPQSEQANLRASIIGAMGKAKAGKQGSEGENFSLDTFLTNWNQIGETAKNAYFGPEARAALNDLAKIAEGTREAQTYRNMSNTGGVVGNLLTLFSGAGGVLTFAKVVGTQYAIGRLLASPRFARWLARAPKAKNPQAYVGKLRTIAAAEPAIKDDVLSLHQRLSDAFGAIPTQAAASDNEGNEQRPQ